MTEREMLEAAARAVGMQAEYEAGGMWVDDGVSGGGRIYWNARHKSSDSWDLVAALRISVEHNGPDEKEPWVLAYIETEYAIERYAENVPDESQRADRMRLAILRCAAAQAPKTVGAGGRETSPETAETRMDTGFHRGREVSPDTVLLEGGEA